MRTFTKAIEEVTSGALSERKAAVKYGIPRSTLRWKLKGKHTKCSGTPTVFSAEEQLLIASAIIGSKWFTLVPTDFSCFA